MNILKNVVAPWALIASTAMLGGCIGDAPTPGEESELLAEDSTDGTGTAASPPLKGLMSRSGSPANGGQFIDNAVVLLNWKDLEPMDLLDPADPRWNFEALHNAVSKLKADTGGAVHNVKVRILAGDAAPGFVKRAGGPAPDYSINGVSEILDNSGPDPKPIRIDCQKNGGSERGGIAVEIGPEESPERGCVPFFWTDPYLSQYDHLMKALAYALDNDPLLDTTVSSVVNSACMTIHAEPFYRAQKWGESNLRLFKAGLTHEADLKCQKQAILTHKEAFGTKRRTALAINNWDIVDGTSAAAYYRTAIWHGNPKHPFAVYELVQWAEQELTIDGTRMLEIQNNGLGESANDRCKVSPSSPASNHWCYIAVYPGPKGFQTETWKNLQSSPVNLYQAIENGISMGAQFIELPAGYTGASQSVLACYDQKIELGTSTICNQ